MSRLILARAVVCLLLCAGPGFWLRACGAEPEDAALKEKALAWLDEFAARQVLFHTEDVLKARGKVAAMSPEEAAAWWKEKAPQREALSSREWLETEKWLREFLKVQAVYSADEIRQMQTTAAEGAKESPQSLEQTLGRIIQARKNLASSSKSAAEMRKFQVEANEAYKRDQVRQRDQARRQARAASAPSVTPPPIVQKKKTRYNEPLIDSLDAARWSVIDSVFPRL